MAEASSLMERQGSIEEAVRFEQDFTASREMTIRAARYVRRARELDVRLDFSDASIGPAEEFGLRLWGMLPGGLTDHEAREIRARLMFDLGAYFGETFIRNHGGWWGWAGLGGRRMFALRTRSGFIVFPTRKARKRLLGHEPDDTLASMYHYLARWPAIRRR